MDPDDRQTNYTVSLINGTLTITMAVPALAWTNPVPITYGAPLTTNQLDATTTVPGSFAYYPTNGTVLDAGTNTLSVIFSPADTVDYSGVTDSVAFVVSPAPLTVTASNVSQPYGQIDPVFAGAITGVTNGDNITASYSCSATADSPVGTYPIVPDLVDPGDRQTNYTVTLINGTLTITGTPILAWTNPAPITYGTPLTSNQLNATTSVPGSFAYNPTNGTVLYAGTNTPSVIFTPADTVDFSSVTDTVSLVVLPAPLTVTASNVSQPYGQFDPAFTGTITGVTNGDNITASYSCGATANSPVGTYPIVAGLVDPEDLQTNYTVTLINGTLTITGAPILAWINPAAITYGGPLTTNQLNATTSVSGSFAYNPTNGTVLHAGTNTLSVIFTPADTVDYSSVTDTVRLVVSPAPLTMTAANATRSVGQTNPLFTGTLTGVTNGDNITASYSCSATTNSPVGTYPIVPGLVDPDDLQTNYAVTMAKGTLTITHGRSDPGLDESRCHHLWSAPDLQPIERRDECARQLRLQPDERHCFLHREQHAVGHFHAGGHG